MKSSFGFFYKMLWKDQIKEERIKANELVRILVDQGGAFRKCQKSLSIAVETVTDFILGGSKITENGFREPAREIPPMTKVMWKRTVKQGFRTQRAPQAFSNIYPQTRICLFYYFMTFTNSSDINRGLFLTTFLWRKSTQGYS